MKRKLTPAQELAAKERREKFHAIIKQVANMGESERLCLAAKMGAIVTCEGHAMSLNNTLLIALQNPGATIVGGFRQWIKQGRAVRKDEHGCMIWIPKGEKKANGMHLLCEHNPEPKPGDVERCAFFMGTVFDVAQTQEIETGKPEQVEEVKTVELELVEA